MKLSLVLFSLGLSLPVGATILPDAGTVYERPLVNRCISYLIGENKFGDDERRLVIDRVRRLKESTSSLVFIPRLHGFSTELPRPPQSRGTERSRKPARLQRLLRDLQDPKVDKELHVLKGKETIQRFLDAQVLEQSTLDQRAKPHVGSDYKAGRALLSVGRIAGAAGLGFAYTRWFGGEPALGVMLGTAAGFYDTLLLGDRGRYVYRKVFETPAGQQPADWRTEQLHYALDKVQSWSPATNSETWRYFGVTSVIPDSLADALGQANTIEDIDPKLFVEFYRWRSTNKSRWDRLSESKANFLSVDFIFTPSELPEEQELIVISRLARQFNL